MSGDRKICLANGPEASERTQHLVTEKEEVL
jgi:hypothetical protein